MSSMTDASTKLPKRKFRKHLKPYWCPELSQCSKAEKSMRNRWIAANKPCDKNDKYYIAYKNAKREFQRKLRQSKRKYELQQHLDILKQGEISQKHFWYLVNKIRKPKGGNTATPIKFPNGTTASEDEDLAEQWRIYFEQLSTPDESLVCDHDFKIYIETLLTEIEKDSQNNFDAILGQPVLDSETTKAIKQLKRGKACAHDNIFAEHMKHSSNLVHNIITHIINAIIICEYIPESFRMGTCIPLHKGGEKVRENPDNFRKLTLLTSLCKVFETILLNRSDENLHKG